MWKRLACLVFPLHTPGRGAPSTHLPACRLRVIAVESCDDAPPCAAAPPILTLPILTPALDCAGSGPASVRVDGVAGLSLKLWSRLQRSPGYHRRNPRSCVRVPTLLREQGSPPRGFSLQHLHLTAALSALSTSFSLAQFLAAVHRFSFHYARYATPICLPSPPLDASAWVEIPLALVGDIVAY